MKIPPLDQLEGYLTGERTNGLGRPLGVEVTLALVAELRAARQQLDEYEYLRSTLVTRFNLGSALRPALVAEWVIAIYDKAVG